MMQSELKPRRSPLTRRRFVAGCIYGGLGVGSAWGAAAPAQEVFYAPMQISAGENGPRLDTGDQGMWAILAGLHNGALPGELAEQLDMSSAAFTHRLDDLVAEGLVHRAAKGRFVPSVPVVTYSDAARFMKSSPDEIGAFADAISSVAPHVEMVFENIQAFRKIEPQHLSLLLFSDVLLDNWQIDGVEAAFLHTLRPLRRGGRYYFALFEDERVEIGADRIEDTFGIYGNHQQSVGTIDLCLYGNRRYRGPPNLVMLPASDVQQKFGFPAGTGIEQARSQLTRGLVALAQGQNPNLTETAMAGLYAYGLIDPQNRTLTPLISSDDDRQLYSMAAAFRPVLISILKARHQQFQDEFSSTPYANEGISFNEWFIWRYHFLYTAVTDELIHRGLIKPPVQGNVTYLSKLS